MNPMFERKGRKFIPTQLCRGQPGKYAVHRGPATALLARAVETSDGAEGTFVTTVAVEVLRPIPFESLETFTCLVRRGRAVEVVESVLSTETSPVMRMIAVRIRHAHFARAPGAIEDVQSLAPTECATNPETVLDAPSGFHSSGVEHRFIRVPCDKRGPAADWMRLKIALLSNEPTSALCRVCAVADVGLSLSSEPPRGRVMNTPDLTVRLTRHARGEWFCVDGTTDGDGSAGGAMTRLLDRHGLMGHARRELVVAESRRSRSRDIWIARRERAQGDTGDVEPASGLV